MIWVLAAVSAGCAMLAALRWLRVAQREHYLGGVTRFARLWWTVDGRNVSLLALGILGVLLAWLVPLLGLITGAVAVIGPIGLGLRGRTSALVWTNRMRRLALFVGLTAVSIVVVGAVTDLALLVVAVPLATPLLIDLSLGLVAPYERRQGNRWVEQAAAALQRVGPTVVAITGSYGKTSTKNVIAHLLGGVHSVMASPASFNNRMGLARSINEQLAAGTEVFVAEMGTYGPGEIRDLCRWITPDVAVITALGPVHLERMGTIERIAQAKSEILEDAPVAVVAIDHPLLAEIASRESPLRRVITVSAEGNPADVTVSGDGAVTVRGASLGSFPVDRAHPVNVACAVGVLLALDLDPARVADRLGDLPEIPHRRTVGRSERGFDIIDDTFNANPAGASAALGLLAGLGTPGGRKVVVTPGMVELGGAQQEANREFGLSAGAAGVTDFIVVNRTNRDALVRGAREAGISSVIVFDTRDEAVRWIRDNLVEGDAILYENDLPDHYP